MRFARLVSAPLRSADTYRRWAYLVVGGALFLPFYLAVLVASSLEAGGAPQDPSPGRLGAGLAVAALLGAATSLVPGVRAHQTELARALVRGRLADAPAVPAQRREPRAAVWLGLHLVVGFGVSVATMVGLTESALLALAPVTDAQHFLLGAPLLPVLEVSPWLGPVAGAVVLAGLVYGVALIGAGADRFAPVLLGPSTTDRLAAAQARAEDLRQRNDLAAELHDSIGHALSVVALQAGAAERVLDADPTFARGALEAIAEQARTASAELDHVLGLLREERSGPASPRDLRALEDLVEGARATGADIRLTVTGHPDAVPPTVSREVFRLIQEGITNALRHGTEGPIAVAVDVGDGGLRVRITNAAAPGLARRTADRHGLRTMGDRMRVLGGELHADSKEGRWRLTAAVPWGPAR